LSIPVTYFFEFVKVKEALPLIDSVHLSKLLDFLPLCLNTLQGMGSPFPVFCKRGLGLFKLNGRRLVLQGS